MVLLATARVRLKDRFGTWFAARALVDQGSESSIISERLAQKLKLPRAAVTVNVFGVGGQKAGVARGQITLRLAPRLGDTLMSVTALVLPRLAIRTGHDMGPKSWPHLAGLQLADPEYCAGDPVDLLLGADVYAAILQQGLRRGKDREPIAQNTSLGWLLSGAIDGETGGQCIAVRDRSGSAKAGAPSVGTGGAPSCLPRLF